MAVLKKSTFFTALFCLAIGQVRSESEPPRCWKEMQYEGTIIAEKENVETPYRCLEFCQGTPGCKFFTHYSSRNSCFAFSDTQDSDDYDCRGDCTSGEVACELTCNASGFCGENSFLIVYEFTVFDIQQCQRDCQANEECQWYTFSLEAQMCWLWKNCNELITLVGSFTGRKECPIVPLCNVEGKCSGDSSLVGFFDGITNSPEECLKECQANEQCTWYSFDPEKIHCYLWDRCDDLQSEGETISGEQICPIGDPLSTTTEDPLTTPEDVGPLCNVEGKCSGDSSLVGFNHGGVNSPEECLKECQANDECTWYSFDPKKNDCYLWDICDDLQSDGETISGEQICPIEPDDATQCDVPGTCEGVLVDEFQGITKDMCLRGCYGNDKCEWFTFNELDNFCIHWADCTLIDEAACSTCISGQKECDDGHPLPTTTED